MTPVEFSPPWEAPPWASPICRCPECVRQWKLSGSLDECEVRANELLCEYLDEKQKAQWLTEGQFIVEGSSGGRYEVGPNAIIEGACIYPMYTTSWPIGDRALTVLLLIKTNERLFRRLANSCSDQLELQLLGH